MKKLILFALLFTVFSAHAELEFESSTFVVTKVLNACASCELESLYRDDSHLNEQLSKVENGVLGSDTSYLRGDLGLTNRQLLIGTIFIREHDNNTFERRITSIPAYLKLESKGLIARIRLEKNTFRLINLSGKQISDIFGNYQGLRAGVNLLAVGGGVRYALKNQKNIGIVNLQSVLGFGLGVEASYINAELVPGYFSRDSEIITGKATIRNDAKNLNSTVDIKDLMSLKISN